MADDCTAKQTKVSYARVLVEVDITKEFVTDIKVRDTNGKMFTQKAIPEWKPYFCHECNKVGHDCKITKEATHQPISEKSKEKDDHLAMEGKKIWIPSTLARVVTNITNIEELRMKLATTSFKEEDNGGDHKNPENNAGTQNSTQPCNDDNTEEENEWTPVPPGKVARKRQSLRTTYIGQMILNEETTDEEGAHGSERETNERGGIPENPFDQ